MVLYIKLSILVYKEHNSGALFHRDAWILVKVFTFDLVALDQVFLLWLSRSTVAVETVMLEDENQVKYDGADWEEELDDIKASSREELVAACAKSVNKLLEEWEGASCEIQ